MERNNTEVFKIALKAVNQLVDFVKPTFGPNNRNILTKTAQGTIAIDDGYRIALDFTLENPLENAVIDIVKEDIKKFNAIYGEGTTGFLIMVQALMKELDKLNYKASIPSELKKAVGEAKTQLKALSKPVTKRKELQNIAKTSYNNEKVSGIISDFLLETGEHGLLGIEHSETSETYIEKLDGYKIENGRQDKNMPNILEHPYVLLTDQELSEGQWLLPLMEKIISAGGRHLLIIAKKVNGSALATILQNHVKGVFHTLVIELNDAEALEDIQLITGGEVLLGAIGVDLSNISLSQLGKAKRVMADETNSFIVGEKRSKELEKFCKTLKDNPKRLAKLRNTVGVIKIGSSSNKETTAIMYKVEDAIHAVKLAQKGGMVPGAGVSLAKIKTSSSILNKALKVPVNQLQENDTMGVELNLAGVMDPTEVLVGQLESAVSTASLLAGLCGIQAENKDDKKESRA